MGEFFKLFKNILLLVLTAVLFAGCSEKGTKETSALTKFSDVQFQAEAQKFAQQLYSKNYAQAYQFLSKDLQSRMSVQKLQSNYETLLKDSGLKKFKLQETNNYMLFYEKQAGGGTLGIAKRPSDFDLIFAHIIIEGAYEESDGEELEDYTAYSIEFAVEDDALKISEIDFHGHL